MGIVGGVTELQQIVIWISLLIILVVIIYFIKK